MLYDPAPQIEQLSMLAWSEAVVVSAMAFPFAHIVHVVLQPAMLVAVLTECVELIVYVADVNAVIVVPVVMPVPEIAIELRVCPALIVYVPIPPVPSPTAVIVVPAVIPLPEIVWPTAIVPADTAVTVSVVSDIVPVNNAAATAL